MKHLIALALSCFALVGCAPDEPLSGTVTTKTYEPSTSQVVMMPVFTGKVTVLVPITQVVPECYRVTVSSADGEQDGCVAQATWESLAIGQTYKEGH